MMSFHEWLAAQPVDGEIGDMVRLVRFARSDSDAYRDARNWLYMHYQDEVDAHELAQRLATIILGQ